MIDTNAALDEGDWEFVALADGSFNLRALTEAGGAGDTVFSAKRGTGATIALIEFGANIVGSAPLLHVQEEQTSGTNPGTFTSGAWRTRILNTVKTNEIIGASLASSQVTLPVGTYWAEWSASAYAVNSHQTKLANATDVTDIEPGSSEKSHTSDGSPTRSLGCARFTLAGIKAIELQHRCATTNATDGFGLPSSFGTEVYAILKIWKVG